METQATFIVSSRSVGHKSSMQVTIPAAIAKQLPQGKSIRWELTIADDGLHLHYLGQEVPIERSPQVTLPWVAEGGSS